MSSVKGWVLPCIQLTIGFCFVLPTRMLSTCEACPVISFFTTGHGGDIKRSTKMKEKKLVKDLPKGE